MSATLGAPFSQLGRMLLGSPAPFGAGPTGPFHRSIPARASLSGGPPVAALAGYTRLGVRSTITWLPVGAPA